jgi:hypothetical protein
VVEQRFCKPLVGSSNLSAGTGPDGSLPVTSLTVYTGDIADTLAVKGFESLLDAAKIAETCTSSAPDPAQDAHRFAKQALATIRAWDDDRLGFLHEHADC